MFSKRSTLNYAIASDDALMVRALLADHPQLVQSRGAR